MVPNFAMTTFLCRSRRTGSVRARMVSSVETSAISRFDDVERSSTASACAGGQVCDGRGGATTIDGGQVLLACDSVEAGSGFEGDAFCLFRISRDILISRTCALKICT